MFNHNFQLRKCLIRNALFLSLIYLFINILFHAIYQLHFNMLHLIFIGTTIIGINLVPYIKIKIGIISIVYFTIFVIAGIVNSLIIIFIEKHFIHFFYTMSISLFLAGISMGITTLNIGKFLSEKTYEEYKNYVSEFVDNSSFRLILCFSAIVLSVFLLALSLNCTNYNLFHIIVSIFFVVSFAIIGAIITSENNNRIKREVTESFEKIVKGDFNISLKCYSPDECGKLSLTIAEVVNYISEYTSDIKKSKKVFEEIIETLLHKFNTVFDKIDNSIEIISSTLNSINKGKDVYEKMYDTGDMIFFDYQKNYENVKETLKVYEEIVDTINHINFITTESFKSAQSIKLLQSKLISIINGSKQIADNIKILAINAEIEASDAGEYGKRFSVIAEQIRKLSDNSSKTSNNIEDTISIINDYILHLTNDIEKASFILSENERKMKKMAQNAEFSIKSLENLKFGGEKLMNTINEAKSTNRNIIETSDKGKLFLENSKQELIELKNYFIILAESIENLQIK